MGTVRCRRPPRQDELPARVRWEPKWDTTERTEVTLLERLLDPPGTDKGWRPQYRASDGQVWWFTVDCVWLREDPDGDS